MVVYKVRFTKPYITSLILSTVIVFLGSTAFFAGSLSTKVVQTIISHLTDPVVIHHDVGGFEVTMTTN